MRRRRRALSIGLAAASLVLGATVGAIQAQSLVETKAREWVQLSVVPPGEMGPCALDSCW